MDIYSILTMVFIVIISIYVGYIAGKQAERNAFHDWLDDHDGGRH